MLEIAFANCSRVIQKSSGEKGGVLGDGGVLHVWLLSVGTAVLPMN